MKNRILLLWVLTVMWVSNASAELLTGHVLLNGKEITAEYTKLSGNTVALGSGFNACISQYSEGRIHVPSTVKIGGTTYRVTEVKSLAFRLCSKISFINFEENITRIGEFACVGCNELEGIELPSSLVSIGSGAFIDLPKLRSVVCTGGTPPRWERNDVFNSIEGGISGGEDYSVSYLTVLSIPDDFVNTYSNAEYSNPGIGWTHPVGWKSFRAINNLYLDNFRIYKASDLTDLRDLLTITKYPDIRLITLENDVDMSGLDAWTYGIGNNYESAFKGEFDGYNHTIRGLRIVNPDEKYVGLFGFCAASSIKNLRLKDCTFEGKVGVGALIGFAENEMEIDNIYLDSVNVTGKYEMGGLIGGSSRAMTPHISIQNCVMDENCTLQWKEGYDDQTDYAAGGLVGFAKDADIQYCAVLYDAFRNDAKGVKAGPFVGKARYNDNPGTNYSSIDYCYYAQFLFDDYDPQVGSTGIQLGSHNVIAGRDEYQLGVTTHGFGSTMTFGNFVAISNMKTFFMAPILGLDHWCYKMGKYPMPVCMEAMWPVEKNVFTLRPKDCTSDRVNGLSLLDEVPEQAWYTFTKSEGDDRAFYYHQFKASRLWLDEEHEMNIRDFPAMLPIGLGTITATDGIEYNRELRAKDIGVKYYNVPNFEYDEEKQEFVKGEDGYPIETGTYTTIEDGRDFQPMGYSVYLPYTMRIPAFTKVYQPHAVRTEGDVTTVAFKEIEGDEIKAFTPYYVVVEKDTISLSTEAEVVCPIVTASKVDLQTFEFLGTTAHLDRTESSNKYILQSDGKWHNVTGSPNNVYIPAFRSYFQPKTDNGVKSLNMIFGDFDDTTGISQIKTLDRDGTERYYDLNGRLIQGKPTQRGIYIKNGKKILVE